MYHDTAQYLADYKAHLSNEERSDNTIQKYLRDVEKFLAFLGQSSITKDKVLAFKAALVDEYAPSSVNSMLAAVNGFLAWLNLTRCRVKPLKLQRSIFSHPEKELSQSEYTRLIQVVGKSQSIIQSNENFTS